jgi:hypothetical protein
MTDSTQSLFTGIALATFGFMLKEAATTRMRAHRLRKVLKADIASTLPGLREHKPLLSKMKMDLADNSVSYIWDSSSHASSPAFLADVPIYLSIAETTALLRFYDCLSRIDAIRTEFNGAVRCVITDAQNRDQYRKIAVACLGDLDRNYVEALTFGDLSLAELDSHYWKDDEPGF